MVLRPAALGLLGRAHELLDRARMIARVAPVAGERADHLTGRAGRAFEELGHERVAPRTVRAGQEVVRDVADQDMREGELLLAFDDRRGLAANQIAALELLEQACEVPVIGVHRAERAVPEDPPDDGGVEEECPLRAWQRVQAGGDEPADARRKRPRRGLVYGRGELLDEEGVALGDA